MNSEIPTFLLIPGIQHLPGDFFAWTDRAARELRLQHGADAEKLEYSIGKIRMPGKMDDLVENLSRVVAHYNVLGITPNIVAHSNGNVLVCRMLRRTGVKIGTLYMVMPACWSSCEWNGLNEALIDDRVERVVFFGSKSDAVVRWGGLLTGWLSFAGLGYGRASYTGLTDIHAGIASRIKQIDLTPWGHSEFAESRNLTRFLNSKIMPYI